MSQYCEFENNIETPKTYPDPTQRWMPSLQHPYPMNFVQAPSPTNQVLVYYNGKPQLQGLSTVKGPVMYHTRQINCKSIPDLTTGNGLSPRWGNPKNSWERKHAVCPRNNAIMYPTTHSIPGPYLQSYIAIPNRMYMY